MAKPGFSLALEFDRPDPQFAYGVEVGRLWEMMRQAVETGEGFDQEVHAVNAEMCIRMGESLDLDVSAELLDDTWMLVKVGSA